MQSEVLKPRKMLGIRHLQAFLLFLSTLLAYTMRVNMSMAIVSMTDITNDNSFKWSIQTQSVILSSFFWGYFMLQIPAGELAARFGAMTLIALSIALNSAICLLLPTGAYYGGWRIVCACRFLQGLGQGFTYPALHNLIGKWVPLEEKSRIGTFIYAGTQTGTAIQMLVSGFIANSWGWPAIFYVNGTLGAIWTVVYVFLGSDSPEDSKMISAEERLYIQTSIGQVGKQKKLKTPWKSIFTSSAFLSLLIMHCCQAWGMWTLMTEIPTYLTKVMDVDIQKNGLISALPYLIMVLLSFPFGFIVDYVTKRKILSITAARKISNSIGLFGPAIALIALSYTPTGNMVIVVGLLVVVVGLNAGHYTGFMLVHIDMSPNFAGTMMGITNCIANLITIAAPIVVGLVLKDETDPTEWRVIFLISSAVYAFGNLVFIIFGSSERQPWNDQTDKKFTDLKVSIADKEEKQKEAV